MNLKDAPYAFRDQRRIFNSPFFNTLLDDVFNPETK